MANPGTPTAYREDGFSVVKQVVGADVVAGLQDEIHDIFRPVLRRNGIDGADSRGPEFETALEMLFASDVAGYLAAAKATQLSPKLHALGAAGPVLSLVQSFGIEQPLIAVRPVVHILSDRLKVPGGYHRTPPHQDWRSVQGSLDALVVWLPLVPVDPDFGTLEVLPQSHLAGLRETQSDPFGNVVADGEFDSSAFVPLSADPGDAVVFSMFTVHRTGLTQRPGIRWAVSLRYNNAAAEDFVANNYPNPFVYRSQDELLRPEPPGAAALRAIFQSEESS